MFGFVGLGLAWFGCVCFLFSCCCDVFSCAQQLLGSCGSCCFLGFVCFLGCWLVVQVVTSALGLLGVATWFGTQRSVAWLRERLCDFLSIPPYLKHMHRAAGRLFAEAYTFLFIRRNACPSMSSALAFCQESLTEA